MLDRLNITRLAAVFILSLSGFMPMAPSLEAGPWSKRCETVWYASGLGYVWDFVSVPKLPDSEVALWNQTFAPDSDFQLVEEIRRSDSLGHESLLTWWVFERLPEDIKQHILSVDSRKPLAYFRKLSKQFSFNFYNSYLFEMLVQYRDYRFWNNGQLISLREWIEAGLARLEIAKVQEPEKLAELKHVYQQGVESNKKTHFWNHLGTTSIPKRKLGLLTYEFQVGDRIYRGRKFGRSLLLYNVPVSDIRIPEWNPTPEQDLREMIEYQVQSPKYFPAVLGLDGKFYLMDGNKRFKISGQSRVTLEINPDLFPVTFRAHLDLVGIRQPSEDIKLALMLGELTLQDIYEAEFLDSLILLDSPTP